MEIILILSIINIVLCIVCFISIRINISKGANVKDLEHKLDVMENLILNSSESENKKTEIRNKYNEKENDIDNSTTVDNGILPNNKKIHNHNFNK